MSIDVSPYDAPSLGRGAAPLARATGSGHRGVETLPDELQELVPVLRLAAEVLDRAAARLVPAVDGTDRVCDRYRAAIASWPSVPAPSYERLAGLLSALHEAGAAVRGAAARCDAADHAVRTAVGRESGPAPAGP